MHNVNIPKGCWTAVMCDQTFLLHSGLEILTSENMRTVWYCNVQYALPFTSQFLYQETKKIFDKICYINLEAQKIIVILNGAHNIFFHNIFISDK